MKLKDLLQDGDCFMLSSMLSFDVKNNKLGLDYLLMDADFVHETECNQYFCHIRKTRSWLDVVTSKINPDIESYIKLFYPPHDPSDPYVSMIREQKILRDLSIYEYVYPECTTDVNSNGPRNYKPCRG